MATVFVTGANRGLGAELTRQYLELGDVVIGTYRSDPGMLLDMQDQYDNRLETLCLDVSDFSSFQSALKVVTGRPIDMLINNAGTLEELSIPGGGTDLHAIDSEMWLRSFSVNTIAPILLSRELATNLVAGSRKLVVTVSSRMGSIADNSSGGYYMYRSSKAAVNAATRSLAIELQLQGIVAVVIHPGWVRTRLGGDDAPLLPEASVAGMVKVIGGLTRRDSGKFLAYDGSAIPW